MTTQLFFLSANTGHCSGVNSTNLAGTAQGWQHRALEPNRGAAATTATATTVLGPTAGLELGGSLVWISEPLDAPVTISGTITFNLRMAESMTSANATAQCVVERIDHTGAIVSTVVNSARGTEMGTSEAAQNWTASPTSTDFNKGDRIRVRVACNDATAVTMASGLTITFWYDGPTAAASGDSYITFNETFTFLDEAASGTVIYLTDVASDVSTSSVDREAWTNRGDGVNDDITASATGFTSPIQVTDTSGGTAVDWWTKALTAFTLGDDVVARIRARELTANTRAAIRVEISVCDGDGTNCTVWAGAQAQGTVITSEGNQFCYLAGSDTSVANGQRLRIRVLWDDGAASFGSQVSAMVGSRNLQMYYDGTTADATGDTYITFTQTLTEFTGGGQVDLPRRRMTQYLPH